MKNLIEQIRAGNTMQHSMSFQGANKSRQIEPLRANGSPRWLRGIGDRWTHRAQGPDSLRKNNSFSFFTSKNKWSRYALGQKAGLILFYIIDVASGSRQGGIGWCAEERFLRWRFLCLFCNCCAESGAKQIRKKWYSQKAIQQIGYLQVVCACGCQMK